MNSFRERLNHQLAKLGMTQAEFARILGVEPQNVNQWKARGGISRNYFIKACDLLKCSPQWLADGKKAPASLQNTNNKIGEEPPPQYVKHAGTTLTEEEHEMLNIMKQLTPQDRDRLVAVGRAFIEISQ